LRKGSNGEGGGGGGGGGGGEEEEIEAEEEVEETIGKKGRRRVVHRIKSLPLQISTNIIFKK